jgi:hypothetical protein
MRFLSVVFVIGLVSALFSSPAQAQLSRGDYTATCDPNLQVGNVTSSQVSANCHEQDLGSRVIGECLNTFIEDVDSVGESGEELVNTVHELQALDTPEQIKRGGELAVKKGDLLAKAYKLIKSIREGSSVVQDYASSCVGNGVIMGLGLKDEYATLMAANKAVDTANKVSDAVSNSMQNGVIELPSGASEALSFLKTLFNAGQALQKALNKIDAVADSWQGAEARANQSMTAANGFDLSCDMQQADNSIKLAGQDAVVALTEARYKRAQARSVSDCWAHEAMEYFEKLPNGTGMAYVAGVTPPWQTMNLSGNTGLFALDGCTSCRHWQEAQQAVPQAEAEEQRLESYLARVNGSCQELTRQVHIFHDLETQYSRWSNASELALRPGSCNLAAASQAAQEMRKLEQEVAASTCASNNAPENSISVALEIQNRARDADCSASARQPAAPVIGPVMPRSNTQPATAAKPWSGTASGTCHVVFEGYNDGRNYVKPHAPYDFKHSMGFQWNEEHKVYVVTSGSQTIVGAGPSFSFNDKCEQKSSNYQPGCIYKSRSNFTTSGTITVSGNSVTYQTRTIEDMNLDIKIADGNCTLTRDNP